MKIEFEKLEKSQLIKLLAFEKLDLRDAELIVNVLKQQKLVESVVYVKSTSNKEFVEYLLEFWNWEKSAYIKEKKFFNHSIHRRYTERNLRIIENHYRPYFKHIKIGEITRFKIREFQLYLMSKDLSSESVNQITRVCVTALKWGFYNRFTENNCFEGITYCAVKHNKRNILSPEDAVKLFEYPWKNADSKLANLTAMCTGLRAGEIQALRFCDIGDDRLFIRNSWSEYDGKLKCPKNGEEREVPVPDFLITLLKNLKKCNSVNEDFIFKSETCSKPSNSKKWRRDLKKQIAVCGIKNTEGIVFHSWRHFYSTVMSDVVDIKKLKVVTGHKSLEMIKHYSDHVLEKDFMIVQKASNNFFDSCFKNCNLLQV